MARGPVKITLPKGPGILAGVFVLVAILGPLIAIAAKAGGVAGLGPADWAAVRFTIVQALLSAALSVALAVPVARALARRDFPGRGALVTLMGAPFLLPVIVAISGLLAIYGRKGGLNAGLSALGLPEIDIYGLDGVVLAHVFLNLPLAVRFLLQGWLSVPAEQFRLVAMMNLSVWRLIEWPMLRATAPGAFLLILLLCLSSFAVALILGGGPRATTVELSIYQAVRFQFDLAKAAALAGLQLALCLGAALAVGVVTLPGRGQAAFDRVVARYDGQTATTRLADAFWIGGATLFLAVPLAAIAARGAMGLPDVPFATLGAAARSVVVALGATGFAIGSGLALAFLGGRFAGLVSVLPLAISGMVLGTGWFVILNPIANPTGLALWLTALANGLAALPFVTGLLAPAVKREVEAWGHLSASLSIEGWDMIGIVLLPRLRRSLAYAAGLSVAFAMGDLGVVALFGGQGAETLPLLMANLMGSYKTGAAAGVGLILVTLSLLMFWVIDRGGRTDA